MKETKGFNLYEVILIIIVTAAVSAVSVGAIMTNIKKKNNPSALCSYVTNDEYLTEFVDVYKTIKDKYYSDVNSENMLNAAEEAMINYLGDKYTNYLSNNEFNDMIDNLNESYKGIGISLNGRIVKDVIENSPASRAEIIAGDEIVNYNNNDITNMSDEELSELINNDNSEVINLTIKRNEFLLEFSLKKEDIENKAVVGERIEDTDIGYIYIKNFSINANELFKKELSKLESSGINSLIIDVREDGGGYLSAAENIASIFLQKGKVIYSLKANNKEFKYKDETDESKSIPVVVLINEHSASASEVLAAALKDSYGATLVGNKSYGKGKVQQVINLSSGDSVKYTSSLWLTPAGICIDGIGISPDYLVSSQGENIIDYQLNKAIELLK